MDRTFKAGYKSESEAGISCKSDGYTYTYNGVGWGDYVYVNKVNRFSGGADIEIVAVEDYDNTFYMSSESVKELIVAFRNKKLLTKVWKTPYEMVRAITEDFYVTVLPVDNEVMKTYSQLEINQAE